MEGVLRLSRETFGTLSKEDFVAFPPDMAKNLKHYLHGAKKVEE